MINKNEIKKELYKSKAMAKFSHYISRNLYYKVELNNGIYQFPIPIIKKVKLQDVVSTGVFCHDDDENKYVQYKNILYTKTGNMDYDDSGFEEMMFDKLSTDLGTTSFNLEMRGSELNRWIGKAIDKDEFTKISN
jgi:hypothetical protein